MVVVSLSNRVQLERDMFKADFDPISALAAILGEERERIARLWSKRLQAELHEVEARSKDLRRPLSHLVNELARLLRDRGEDGIRLWSEVIRSHGAARYDLRYEPDDLARELKVLQQVLLRVYARRRGAIEPQIAELVAEIIGEASAAVHASYARVLRTEEVRLRETAVMESLLQHIDVGVVLAEEDGRLSYATPPVSHLLGIPARVLAGASMDALRSVLVQLNARHPNGEPYRVSDLPFARALKSKEEIRGASMVINRLRDGREVFLEMNAIPVREEGTDELYGVVQTLVDRTETTQRARELTLAYEELRRLQGRLLQRTRAQALGQLASGAAHNLNNFLNVLRLRLTLLRREFKPEYLDALDRTVTNITELVARLQDFAAPRSDEALPSGQVLPTVREAVELARPDLERTEPPVQLQTMLVGDPMAKFDGPALRELVVNLTLFVRERLTSGGTIAVRNEMDDGWVVISIEDTGSPFGEEELMRLFDPLKGRSPAPHLSLLLAVGRTQVQHWGGDLFAENLPEGRGIAFRIRLPQAKPAEVAAEAPVPVEVVRHVPAYGVRRVLVVDDEPENARMMAEVLTEEGYEVCVATRGDEGLRMWEDGAFDAALLDALLPDLSGWSVARNIRKTSPDALLAVVTGGDVRGQNRENLAVVDAVFRKPVDVGALDEFLSQTQGSAEAGADSPPKEARADGAAADHEPTVH